MAKPKSKKTEPERYIAVIGDGQVPRRSLARHLDAFLSEEHEGSTPVFVADESWGKTTNAALDLFIEAGYPQALVLALDTSDDNVASLVADLIDEDHNIEVHADPYDALGAMVGAGSEMQVLVLMDDESDEAIEEHTLDLLEAGARAFDVSGGMLEFEFIAEDTEPAADDSADSTDSADSVESGDSDESDEDVPDDVAATVVELLAIEEDSDAFDFLMDLDRELLSDVAKHFKVEVKKGAWAKRIAQDIVDATNAEEAPEEPEAPADQSADASASEESADSVESPDSADSPEDDGTETVVTTTGYTGGNSTTASGDTVGIYDDPTLGGKYVSLGKFVSLGEVAALLAAADGSVETAMAMAKAFGFEPVAA